MIAKKSTVLPFLGLILSLAGCATVDGPSVLTASEPALEPIQLATALPPTPLPELSVEALEATEPVETRSVREILHAAQDALKSANAAQENGDRLAAGQQYALLFQLLLEADIDPAIMYNLRSELARVIDTTTDQAGLFDPNGSGWTAAEFDPISVAGDFDIPYPLPKRVLREIDKIQGPHRKSFQAALDRSYRYVPYIKRELARAGMPEDMVWLAMIESHFKPKVKSHAGAGGMWQFMRSTGKRFGLRIDSQVDERYNWQRATEAAIDYLTELYDIFGGHWPLAIVAYNKGEGGMSRAINANNGEYDVWKLIETPPASYHLRLETKNYYPKLLAYTIVAKDPERYGFKLNPVPPENTVRVPVMGLYALNDLDAACGLPSGSLSALNPDLLRGQTLSLGEYKVAVPAEYHSKFLKALKTVPKNRPDMRLASSKSYGSGFTYRVRKGDTLGGIAKRHGVSLSRLKADNNIRNARYLQIGQRLRIYGKSGGSRSASGPTIVAGGRKIYKVQRNDALSTIAKASRVSVKDIQGWNNLGSGTRINVGQRLYVSAQTAVATSKYSEEKLYHTVKANEFPGKIAHKYHVSLNDFLSWNNLTTRSKIRPGDKLVIYRPVATKSQASAATSIAKAAQPTGTDKHTHTVRRGENASVIAKKYGVKTRDFLKWNGLSTRSVLHIGDKCFVYTKAQTPVAAAALEKAKGGQKTVHVVKSGQNPWTIAKRYGVGVDQLLAWNGLNKNAVLHVGDRVTVLKD